MADSFEIIICPRCGNEMKKIYIDEYNFHVDICIDGCGGIWFDNRELKKFDEIIESMDSIAKIYENKTFAISDTKENMNCPVCNSIMVKTPTNISKNVITDTCYSCGGTFLDYGELEKMRENNDTKEDFEKHFLNEHSQNINQALTDNTRVLFEIPGRKKRIDFMYKLVQKIRHNI